MNMTLNFEKLDIILAGSLKFTLVHKMLSLVIEPEPQVFERREILKSAWSKTIKSWSASCFFLYMSQVYTFARGDPIKEAIKMVLLSNEVDWSLDSYAKKFFVGQDGDL